LDRRVKIQFGDIILASLSESYYRYSKSGTKSKTTDERIGSDEPVLVFRTEFRTEFGRRRRCRQINGSALALLFAVSFESFVACVKRLSEVV
jgi:hypothetical protein